MFVLVLLFCLAGDPNGVCVKLTYPPRAMESVEECRELAPVVAGTVAITDGWLVKGFIPVMAQCFEPIDQSPGTES